MFDSLGSEIRTAANVVEKIANISTQRAQTKFPLNDNKNVS